MKSKIFMFLFCFTLLVVVFQYANTKRYSKAKEKDIKNLITLTDSLQAKVDSLNLPAQENQTRIDLKSEGFTLETNNKAREYFENQNISVDSLASAIEYQIISKNRVESGNPLVPYHGISGKMQVNRIKILNNRWVLAEFTDGKYWGETIISYFLDENNKLQFDTLDGVLYGK